MLETARKLMVTISVDEIMIVAHTFDVEYLDINDDYINIYSGDFELTIPIKKTGITELFDGHYQIAIDNVCYELEVL